MNYLTLTLISALLSSLNRILQKILLTGHKRDPYAFSFVFPMACALLFLLHTILTRSFEIPNLSGLRTNILAMVILYTSGNIWIAKALQLAEASEVSVIFASSSAWSALSAVVFLGETINSSIGAGIALIVLGIATISSHSKKWRLNRGHIYALLSAASLGFAFTSSAYIADRFNSLSSYMFLAFALPALAVLAVKPSSIANTLDYLRPSTLTRLLLCATFFALGTLALFSAYKSGGPASIIAPLQQTNIVLTVIFGYFFLKEKDRLPQKILGAVLTLSGTIFLI